MVHWLGVPPPPPVVWLWYDVTMIVAVPAAPPVVWLWNDVRIGCNEDIQQGLTSVLYCALQWFYKVSQC